jgi:hypothetical protein
MMAGRGVLALGVMTIAIASTPKDAWVVQRWDVAGVSSDQ